MTSRLSVGWLVLGLTACESMPGAAPGMPPLTPPASRLEASAARTADTPTSDAAGGDATMGGPPVVVDGIVASPAPAAVLAPATPGPTTTEASGVAPTPPTGAVAAASAAADPADPLAAALAAQRGPAPAPPPMASGGATGPAPAATPTATPTLTPSAGAGSPPAAPGVRWAPGQPAGRWSVRLLRILPDVAPPRAVLGLPSGREIVVSPGTMVPEEDLVVMAIGADAVQIDRIVPDGDRTRIASEILRPLNATAP